MPHIGHLLAVYGYMVMSAEVSHVLRELTTTTVAIVTLNEAHKYRDRK